MPKFTSAERILVKSIVASLSIKRIPEDQICAEIYNQTNKTLTKSGLFYVKEAIKKESYHWYKTMREGNYEYVHEFRERISEIMSLQRKHHEIIDSNEHNAQIQQTSLAELHRLSITLSNLYDVAPTIIGVDIDATISITPETKTSTTTSDKSSIKYVIKFGLEDSPEGLTMSSRNQFSYDQFVNWSWEKLHSYQVLACRRSV